MFLVSLVGNRMIPNPGRERKGFLGLAGGDMSVRGSIWQGTNGAPISH